ncbi:MAG: iron-containing alcohol dehydrogenase [Deltaproteobacteria bacterium]|nr:iron-containing alcohol dehydrogenase [Deltaproteobacteria bacterium]MBW2309297.1 iron-containing alcohol dehydrogenase [Deltaproteobacteria bacterium]
MEELWKRIPVGLDRIFEFHTAGMLPPNRVIFGFKASERLAAEAVKLARGRLLLVSDRVLAKLGTVARMRGILEAEGYAVREFTEVEPEPHIETAEALHELAMAEKFDIAVGLGGGSVMDVTKLIAQTAVTGSSPRDYMMRKVFAERRGLPMILLPTTSGTGSEVSMNIVLALGKEKRFVSSQYYYPDIAIVDPMLTVSMPPGLTATTGIDALSHAIDGMMHLNASPVSDTLCLGGIELAGSYLRRAVADGEDLEARYHMSVAATLCMMGMILTGALYSHSVSNVLSRYKPAPHGLGCGLGLPYSMAYNMPVIEKKLAKISTALGENTWMLSRRDAAEQAVNAVMRLTRDVGLPVTLQELGGINESDVEEMADIMIKEYHRPLNVRPMGREESVKLWKNLWAGTPMGY